MADELSLFDPFATLAEIRSRGTEGEGQKLPQKLPQAPAEVIPPHDQRVNPASATSATSAGCPDARDLAPAHVQKKGKKYYYLSMAYAKDGRAGEGSSVRTSGHPAEVAEVAEFPLSHSCNTTFDSDGVAEVLRKQLRKFRAGLASLSPDRPPCPDYRLGEWPAVLSRAHDFLDTFGLQALELGWTASRLFGVHPQAGIVRVDACGALVLPLSGLVRAITATSIRFERLTYREKLGQPEGVPLWEFGRNT